MVALLNAVQGGGIWEVGRWEVLAACCLVLTETLSLSSRWLEQTMKGELHFEIRKAGTLHGFTAWFSVRFQSLEEDEPQLVLSTGPLHP